MSKNTELKKHLDAALTEVMAARMLVGGLPIAQPDDALDAALRTSPTVRAARKAFQAAMAAINVRDDAVARTAYLAIEEAADALAASTAAAGWRLGLLAGTKCRK